MTINGGANDDTISSSGDNFTINGGLGDNKIWFNGSSGTVGVEDGNDSIYGYYGKEVSINAGDGNNTIQATLYDYSTVESGEGKDRISVSGSNVEINSGDGNDRITVNASDSTITAGKGNDTIDFKSSNGGNLILYNLGDGTDSIYNFSESDTLSISEDITYSSMVSGDHLIVNVGDDKITIFDASYLSTINIDGNNADTSDTYLVRNSDKSPVSVESSVKNIISFGRTNSVQITGNELANSITGGTKADTLYGASGDDSLTGGAGADLFIYSSGDDVITDYGSGDKISLASDVKISDVSIDGNDVLLTTNNGSLKIIDGYKIRKSNGKISNNDRKVVFVEGKKSTSYIFDEHKIFDSSKTAISLTSGATETNFNFASGSVYSKLKTIDASLISSTINITGNKKNNSITASAGGRTSTSSTSSIPPTSSCWRASAG